MQIRRYTSGDLAGVLRLCEIERWPSLVQDQARADRVLSAPGVTTMVAEVDGQIVGFAQLQSDGEIQAHLSLIAVDPRHRHQGIARELVVLGLRNAGGQRIDLVTDGADAFYEAMPHFRLSGFRIYPEYTGPDQLHPSVVWNRGRRSDRDDFS